MKKYLINDLKTFVLLIVLAVGSLVLIFLGLLNSENSPNSKFTILMVFCIFGSMFLLVILGIVLSIEILVVYDDKIISKRFFKQKTIAYSDIVSIKIAANKGEYAGGIEDGWMIVDSCDKTIFVVGIHSRKWCIDFIKQHIDKTV